MMPRGDRRESRDRHHERGGRGHGGARVGRGDVRAAALMLLADQQLHGYELIQQLAERSGGWRPSPGSIYPALQLLEDQGLIRGEQSDGRRVYHLTAEGKTYMEQHRDELQAAWAGVTAAGDDPAFALRELFEQLGDAVGQVGRAGSAAQMAAAREVLTQARRQIYRILADEFASGAPLDTGEARSQEE